MCVSVFLYLRYSYVLDTLFLSCLSVRVSIRVYFPNVVNIIFSKPLGEFHQIYNFSALGDTCQLGIYEAKNRVCDGMFYCV